MSHTGGLAPSPSSHDPTSSPMNDIHSSSSASPSSSSGINPPQLSGLESKVDGQKIFDKSSPTAAVIGAGLVGSLCAAMLAARGWNVTVYESRSDPRLTPPSSRARSINLALSPRGIEALRAVSEELAERVLKEGIPMRGRMVHPKVKSKNGSQKSFGTLAKGQDYGLYDEGEYINSISRGVLGICLLDYLEELNDENVKGHLHSSSSSSSSSLPGNEKPHRGSVNLVFDTKLIGMNLKHSKGVEIRILENRKEEKTKQVDFVIGGDGAYSRVRRELMQGSGLRFNYKQSFAPHAYLELSIPPGPGSSFSIEPNYLHIWPRGEFMLIALPNQDRSFTLTLFAHQKTFDSIDDKLNQKKGKDRKDPENNPVIQLFRDEFPDALALMGEDQLLKSWEENPKDGLITVECSPYHFEDKVLLIGDAAHAMVPFYGQGMNCAFEDVRVLSTFLDHFQSSPRPFSPPQPLPYSSSNPSELPAIDRTKSSLSQAIASYTQYRSPSLSAIQRLAAHNYEEMASSVLDPLYLLRLSLDTTLSAFFRVFVDGGSRTTPDLDTSHQMTGERRQNAARDIHGTGGTWESLYRMTTFRYGLSYEEALKRRDWQSKVLESIAGIGAGVGLVGLGWLVWSWKKVYGSGILLSSS